MLAATVKSTLPNILKNHYALITLTFALTRILFYIAGIRFDLHFLYLGMQTLDLTLLSDRLSESILYLHSQPPLFNLMIGVVLKLFPLHFDGVFQAIFLIIGFFSSILMYLSLVRLNVNPRLALSITTVYVISPSVILYENWFSYTYPVIFILIVSATTLHLYLESRKPIYGFVFFCMIGAIVLTRSLFHITWLVGVVFVLALVNKVELKKLLIMGGIPALLILCWYGKNYFLFDTFAGSSWFGMSLYKIAAPHPASKAKNQLIEKGTLSPISSLRPYLELKSYAPYLKPETLYTDVRALHDPYKNRSNSNPLYLKFAQEHTYQQSNFNHLQYLQIADLYLEESFKVLFDAPRFYLHNVPVAFGLYFTPSSSYPALNGNAERIFYYEKFYNHLVLGSLINPRDYEGNDHSRVGKGFTISCWTLGLYLLVISTCLYYWKRGGLSVPMGFRNGAMPYLIFTVFYILLVSNLLELGENMRYKFLSVPFSLLILGVFLQHIVVRRRLQNQKS